jgi:adenine phosphoribosyltransferase
MVAPEAPDLKQYIRSIPDFPKKGIVFRDITTLLRDKEAFRQAIDSFVDRYKNVRIDKIVSVESRGFIFGSALAYRLHAGFVPVRKPKKLPGTTLRREYKLEYGTDALEIHTDAIGHGEHILIIDDLLATGGTIRATCDLVKQLGGVIVGVAFLIELSFLNGRAGLQEYDIVSLINYDAE